MDVMMMQTSDDKIYSEMLNVTSGVNQRFCVDQRIEYRSHKGLTRGQHPWQATLNRIDLLYNMLTEGYDGWVLYLDADAWVQDAKFDIRKYLSSQSSYSGIFVPSGATSHAWDINAGVFALNLGHSLGKFIVAEWRGRLDEKWHLISDLATWPTGGLPDDQNLLHSILQDKEVISSIRFETKEFMNSNYASFIRQLLRSEASTFEQRVKRIREAVNAIDQTHYEGANTVKSLTVLANEYGSDKGTVHGHPHKYTYLYDLIFRSYRENPINFLEIGLARGGPEVGGKVDREVPSPSIHMWLEYFTKASVYGFDISDFSSMEGDRFTFVRGDCGNKDDLRRLAAAAPHFDIVIDDASHASYHQLLTFKMMLPKVAAGGLYVIEDLHWQSPYYEGELPKVPLASVLLSKFFEEGVYVENALLSRSDMETLASKVKFASFFPSFTGGDPKLKVCVLAL